MSEDNESLSSDEHNDGKLRKIKKMAVSQFSNIMLASSFLQNDYFSRYLNKRPCMKADKSGDRWVRDLLCGHPVRFHNIFRMSQVIFTDLLCKLESLYGLCGSHRTTTREVLGITLFILSHNESVRATAERFQHSTETISRYFSLGLRALINLAMDIIVPEDKEFLDIPVHIRNDTRYMPYFKDCIGAIDGTHVDARIPVEDQIPYIGRHHSPTQNVMAVCDFNMCFTFVAAGWEDSAHDARIFKHVLRSPQYSFPVPPSGKFYLVDAGYPLQRGFLKPYPETRYHIPDFRRGIRTTTGHREVFNRRHSSLRSVIERAFGVWKKKWRILRDMPNYYFKKQRLIVVATMALHNYIRRHQSRSDPEFDECDADENFVHSEAREFRVEEEVEPLGNTNCSVELVDGEGAKDMAEVREAIAMQLYSCNRYPDEN
ncbi:hypothetical protein MA16_Dca015981 [Dendrobium catenatum]|uniref:Uncharacterized protein n=1 Tax=Dendrobium catenatum TaxID=906689 RepID=A0A2I0VV13_9ASPA|nr:hypothetical protein MA16_Dca015981 [Dendrobium catenatum]